MRSEMENSHDSMNEPLRSVLIPSPGHPDRVISVLEPATLYPPTGKPGEKVYRTAAGNLTTRRIRQTFGTYIPDPSKYDKLG